MDGDTKSECMSSRIIKTMRHVRLGWTALIRSIDCFPWERRMFLMQHVFFHSGHFLTGSEAVLV